ncbi:MAG: hypothetical protein ACYTER_09550 [Planctomycetota bacterium]|jgi:hypothetical protein
MNRVLKYAWYQLIIVVFAIIFAAITLGVIITWFHDQKCHAILVLWPLIFVDLFKYFFPLKKEEIEFDERDVTIKKHASTMALVVFWYVFILSCIIPLVVIGNGSIPVMYLGGLLLAAALIYRITWSISVILQYGRTNIDCEAKIVTEGDTA